VRGRPWIPDDSVATSAIGRNERTAAADTRPDSVESSATDDRDIAVSVTGLSKRFGGETRR